MGPTIDRIEEFPKDGRLWWVRWVDRYRVSKGGTATPCVEVLLSLLDMTLSELRSADLNNIVAAKDAPIAQSLIAVFAGFIPRLPLGSVFQDGMLVACLPLRHERFDCQNFAISIRGVQDELTTKPGWWKFPYRVINRSDYQLAGFPEIARSQVVIIEAQNVVVVFPCHEVFRSMYAPYSEIAHALTSGPWEYTKTQVVNPEGTGPRSDGMWQVTLRRRIKDDFGDLLANLSISSAGKAAANAIHTGLLAGDAPGYMNARIPFDLARLKFEAKGLWLPGNPRKFLALQLTSMEWPKVPPLVIFRDNSGEKGEIQTPVEKNKPFSTNSAEPSVDEEGVVNANSQEDPLRTSTVTTFSLPAVQWSNRPTIIKEKKQESFIYASQPGVSNGREVSGVSPGTPWLGDSNSGLGAYSADAPEQRDASHRLTDVVKMLDLLLSNEHLSGWSPVAHPKPMLHAGALPLWHFPARDKNSKQRLAFSFLDRVENIRRGALVCQLQYRDQTVFWLEIEVSQKESGRKALIYAVPQDRFVSATLKLLEIGAQKRGFWPNNDELMMFAGVSAAVTWKHSYIGKLRKGHGGRLNEARAMVEIASISCVEKTHEESQRTGLLRGLSRA